MDSVLLNRQTLLAKVKENYQKHLTDFEETKKDFVVAIQAISKHNAKIVKQVVETNDFSLMLKIKPFLSAPTSHAKEYERAIAMLEMSIEDNITLIDTQFDQLVRDEWVWKHQFSAMSTLYKSAV